MPNECFSLISLYKNPPISHQFSPTDLRPSTASRLPSSNSSLRRRPVSPSTAAALETTVYVPDLSVSAETLKIQFDFDSHNPFLPLLSLFTILALTLSVITVLALPCFSMLFRVVDFSDDEFTSPPENTFCISERK